MKSKKRIEDRNLKIQIGERVYSITPNGSGGVAYIPIIKPDKKEEEFRKLRDQQRQDIINIFRIKSPIEIQTEKENK